MTNPITQSANTTLQEALNYAETGWGVIPVHTITGGHCSCGKPDCQHPGKHPRTEHGSKDATTDEATIRGWWEHWPDANVGIATGSVSGLVVVDIDPCHDGDESFTALEEQLGPLPETVEVLTGGGGRHLYFRHPGGYVKTVSAWQGFKGVDIRGDGGPVVAPPSLHASGRRYSWEITHGPNDVPLAELPEAWRKVLTEDNRRNGPVESVGEVIADGARNATLTSLAGTMRRRGMTENEIEAALLAANSARCQPPLSEDEVRTIAMSIGRYAPAGTGTEAQTDSNIMTDTTNAELIAKLYGDRIRYDHVRGRWLLWHCHWWGEDIDGEVYRLATEAARYRYQQSVNITDLKERQRVANWAIQSEQRNKLESAVALARNVRPIADSGQGWDSGPWLFAVANGVVDLHTGKLWPGRPEDRITQHSEVRYEPTAKCPRWVKFLIEVFDGNTELIDWLQRALGYSLTGDISEQCLFTGYGGGSNGKTVFLSTVMHVSGQYGYEAPFATFELNARSSIPNDVAALENRRFVSSSETNEGTRLNESRLKALTGGDSITARHLHQEFFTFAPVGKIWLAVNHKPKVTDDSYGFWRRVRLIPFEVQFRESADKNLAAKLRAEASGILNWLIRGCLEWQKRGLEPVPAIVRGATEAYKQESDPLSQFLADCCIEAPDASVRANLLYKAYLGWAEEQGFRDKEKLTNNAFGRRVADRFTKTHTMKGTIYQGVGLRSLDNNHSDDRGDMTDFGENLNVDDGLGGDFVFSPNINPRMGKNAEVPSNPSSERKNPSLPVMGGKNPSCPKNDPTPAEIIALWHDLDCPAIPLRQGETCHALDKLLAMKPIPEGALAAIKLWYENNMEVNQ